ncbi:MAG: peptidoglycan editing factor PgeF [Actinomycetota bacterium]|nr:peptidoglycan editing factor PgeF [Actinomycetota bacterium]
MTSPGEIGEPALCRRAGIEVLTWPALDELGVDAVVTTRHGGVSTGPYESLNLGLGVGDDPDAVVENRRRAARALGASLGDLVVAQQVHGRRATVVGRGDCGRGATVERAPLPSTDALITDERGPVLVIVVADCVPVLLVDPAVPVVAAVHAGWRGTAGRVVDAAIDAMAGLGARPARMAAVIGPAVSKDAYEVGDDVATSLRTGTGADGAVRRVASGRWLADLPGANRQLLVAAGLRPASISVVERTTGAGGAFYSHRAQQPCGRFALLVRLRP